MGELLQSSSGVLGVVAGTVACVLGLLVLIAEVLEFAMKEDKLSYVTNIWNLLPLAGNVANVVSFILVMTYTSAEEEWGRHNTRAWSSVAIILLWLGFFNYLRAYHKCVPMPPPLLLLFRFRV